MELFIKLHISISISDLVDNSGIRLTFTPTLRRYDAGVLSMGVKVNDRQIVPPFEKEFVSSGFCTAECLNKVIFKLSLVIQVFYYIFSI